MLKKDAINHFGDVQALADAAGITREAVYQWPAVVPENRQSDFDILSGGKLRSHIRDRMLVPEGRS